MTPDGDRSAAVAPEPDAKDDAKHKAVPDAKDDLESPPMAELRAKLASSPDGLSQAAAEKRLIQYGPNEIEEEKTNLLLTFLTCFWVPSRG